MKRLMVVLIIMLMQLLDKGNTYDDGFRNCFMFVDGKIEDFHTEKD